MKRKYETDEEKRLREEKKRIREKEKYVREEKKRVREKEKYVREAEKAVRKRRKEEMSYLLYLLLDYCNLVEHDEVLMSSLSSSLNERRG